MSDVPDKAAPQAPAEPTGFQSLRPGWCPARVVPGVPLPSVGCSWADLSCCSKRLPKARHRRSHFLSQICFHICKRKEVGDMWHSRIQTPGPFENWGPSPLCRNMLTQGWGVKETAGRTSLQKPPLLTGNHQILHGTITACYPHDHFKNIAPHLQPPFTSHTTTILQ